MLLSRWDPFAEMRVLRREVDRLFEERERTPGQREGQERLAQGAWTPLVDAYETASNLVFVAELPGLSEGEIDVQLHGDTLTIKGERKAEEVEGATYHRSERAFGPFYRSFTIGTPVNAEGVTATVKDGLLRVTVPKAEEAEPRKVEIKTA